MKKVSDRPPFEAVHNCICAFPDVPILEFYKGYFEAVYILLHPFIQYNSKQEVIRFVSWQEMLNLTQFKNLNQLDIALRTRIGGLRKEHENKVDAEILLNTCNNNNISEPSEGQFQGSLQTEMLKSLLELGYNYMFVADEFGFERKLSYVQEYLNGQDDTVLKWGSERNWYTNNNEIFYTTHWDSHFTMLCSDKKTIESILSKHSFEGFYCNERLTFTGAYLLTEYKL
ncbi:DUF2711 family protein [Mucilaginibacter sp.]|uniref:DUF2711 family protein n=1 Tax=Mucilaginibacter sp. TaxID=1882438 RepID=UPI0035BBE098